MTKFTTLSAAALLCAGAAYAEPNYAEKGFICTSGTSEEKDSCRDTAREYAKYSFSYVVMGPDAYALTHANLEGRLASGSDWIPIARHSSNIKVNQGVTFSFDAEWMAAKLGFDVETLRQTGFHVRGDIKSANVVLRGDRKDKCPRVEVIYDSIAKAWEYRPKTGTAWLAAEAGKAVIWKASGTASDVKCGTKSES